MTKKKQFYYKNNRFQQLRGFYCAALLNSISKAAARLRLTQPSVSLQIKSLERDLGVILLERNGPRIKLTKEGQALLDLITPLVEGIDNLEDNLKTNLEQEKTNSVNVAADQSAMFYLLPEIISDYSKHSPDIKVKLINALSDDAADKVRAGEADIIIGSSNSEIPDDFIFHAVHEYETVLITRPGHPLAGKSNITVEDILKYRLILPSKQLNAVPSLNKVFSPAVIKSAATVEFEGWALNKRFVEVSDAVTVGLSIAVKGDSSVVGTPVPHLFPKGSYGVILRKGKNLTKQTTDFIKVIDPAFNMVDA